MSSFWYNEFQKEKFQKKKKTFVRFFHLPFENVGLVRRIFHGRGFRLSWALSTSHFSFVNDDVSRQFLMLFSLSLSALSFFGGHNVFVVPFVDDIICARAAINYTATYCITTPPFLTLLRFPSFFCSFELFVVFLILQIISLIPRSAFTTSNQKMCSFSVIWKIVHSVDNDKTNDSTKHANNISISLRVRFTSNLSYSQ